MVARPAVSRLRQGWQACLGALVALSAAGAFLPPSSLAASAPSSGAVQITDSGFTPAALTIAVGGTVTWTNTGAGVHSMSHLPGSGSAIDSGGLGAGQSFSYSFPEVGSLAYTSAPDCLNGNHTANFQCEGIVSVVAPGTALPDAAAATPAAVATPPPAPPVVGAQVNISDTGGFAPAAVVIPPGQAVQWINQGQNPHSVVSDLGSALLFDSGVLAAGGNVTITFPKPGTFAYHSSLEPLYSLGVSGMVVSYQFTGTVIVR